MTQRLHADELAIDRALVYRLLAEQQPELAHLPVRLAPAQGSDNVVFRLGEELAVRLPRKVSAIPGLLRERDWLPRLGPRLPLAVPTPVAAGEPSPDYPAPWLVCSWVPGTTVRPQGLGPVASGRLGEFVRALHDIDSADGPVVPAGQRGGPLAALDAHLWPVLEQIEALQQKGRIDADLLDRDRVARVWAEAVAAPAWSGAGTWLHRDLLGANLLSAAGGVGDSLIGVIDFGGLVVGDPAADLMGAFHVVPPQHRAGFALAAGADQAMWARARGIGLLQGLQALPYYLDSHQGMVAMARNVIGSTLSDATVVPAG